MKILLTHSPEALRNYYGERALAGLLKLGEVRTNSEKESLEGEALIRAAEDCDLIVSYRQSPGPAALFERLPKLKAFLRCAIDIRNIDVAAASKAGVLVTQASAGFVTSVSELVLGFLVDLSRGITASTAEYRRGGVPKAAMGRELKGSTLGVRVLVNGMDVGRAPDQMPAPRLAARPDVIATPHTAGLTLPAIEHQSLETVAQAAEIIQGRAPKGAVKAEHWKRKP